MHGKHDYGNSGGGKPKGQTSTVNKGDKATGQHPGWSKMTGGAKPLGPKD